MFKPFICLLLSTMIFITPANASVYVTAKEYIGLNERKHTTSIQNITKVNPRKVPWCAAFLNAILKKSGKKTTGSLSAASFRNYGYRVIKPITGDIVVMKNHVGIFVGFIIRNGKKFVAVLGGNQSNSVKISYYPITKVITFRRPS